MIRTVSPSADMAGAAAGPTLTRTLVRGLRGASGVVTPEPHADAAGYPTRLGTSSGGERLFFKVSFLTTHSPIGNKYRTILPECQGKNEITSKIAQILQNRA
jgi:hypothetical protein